MPNETTIYDLTLLLSTETPEETRAKILGDLESAIQRGGGSVVGRSNWGTRNLTYRIQRQHDAEFHLLQITGPPELLDDLGHSLRIADGVLRHRIIKAVPGSRIAAAAEQAAAPASSPAAAPASSPAAAPASSQQSDSRETPSPVAHLLRRPRPHPRTNSASPLISVSAL
jgi:small subunit ribosomal protein S6